MSSTSTIEYFLINLGNRLKGLVELLLSPTSIHLLQKVKIVKGIYRLFLSKMDSPQFSHYTLHYIFEKCKNIFSLNVHSVYIAQKTNTRSNNMYP